MRDKPENVKRFRKLLPRGAQQQIAQRLGLTHQAVSKALDSLNPSHEAVQEAVRIIGKSDASATQKKLLELLDSTSLATESSAAAA